MLNLEAVLVEIFIASLILGVVAGLFAGLFGIGGGLIIVPVLALLYAAHGFDQDLVMILSVATSLATIIFTSIASVSAHHRLGAVLWDKVFGLVPGIMVGTAIGAVVADTITADSLRTFFIGYLIFVAVQLAFQIKPKPGRLKPSKMLNNSVAVIIGVLSAILGIGGGSLVVPFLVYFQTPMRSAVAVSGACGLPIAVAGTVSYALLGWDVPHRPEWCLGYIHMPSFLGVVLTSIVTAPLGAKLASIIPAQQLKRYFSVLLIIMAVKLVWY